MFAGAAEMWDEQKWVQQMRSAGLTPDAELKGLARRNLSHERAEKHLIPMALPTMMARIAAANTEKPDGSGAVPVELTVAE